jgi:UDP-3-O-[3-hydroxymyristoyl] glucosamine N-acyltransferase
VTASRQGHVQSHGMTLAEILEATGGRLANEAELTVPKESIRIERPSVLGKSGPSDVAFFFSREYEREIPTARAGVLITAEPFAKGLKASGLPLWKAAAIVVCPDPYLAMGILSEKFAHLSGVSHAEKRRGAKSEIHPTAVVDPTAEIGESVSIGPHCVIGPKARIGAGSILYPSCYVGPGTRLGEDCVLFHGVTVYERCEIGNRARFHAGVVIGSDGFGYAQEKKEGKPVRHQKIYHLGHVIVGDDVEIGANSAVDRGTFGDTKLGDHTKIDNQVQVGHNAELSEGVVLCGEVGVGGGVKIGRYALVLGNVGVANGVTVGDYAVVAAHTLVTRDVKAGEAVAGHPQRTLKEHMKVHAHLNRLLDEREARRKPRVEKNER